MKIRNPNFMAPNQARVDALQGKLKAFLASNATEVDLDFETIRARVGPANLTDGEIAQAAQNLGLQIILN